MHLSDTPNKIDQTELTQADLIGFINFSKSDIKRKTDSFNSGVWLTEA